ncbi:uncharacterized protein BO80DRAFT_446818 [Aspergillus ibericus CBS 121593]|uniref:Uncharacterized protein n=1 Tax=Aspergillus ibericus CBS 121593 TaxID=1448316 RepID=A0A395GWC6_9EURO|nr:hypothetical protein BO80DRAFT_446818 [Aspergillus ibericus CBS 121593]RAK98987.1 hypothetical protein BO80DRAFT_446818 [Aspergillus ibericus CBS 121593]
MGTNMNMHSRTRNYWTAEEDQILREEVMVQVSTLGSVKDWTTIAARLDSRRTNKDCRKRWSKLEGNVNKGVWSGDEDERLRRAVGEFGFAWTLVAQEVQTRHADQCAKRWNHFLDPNLIHDGWTDGEDERLLRAVGTYGRVWRVISEKEFPRRSATDLKNRYMIVQRKRALGKPHSSSTSPDGNLAPESTSGYESDSDEGIHQNHPADPFTIPPTDPTMHYDPDLDLDLDIDMTLLPELISSMPDPYPFGPLDPQLSTTTTTSPSTPPGLPDPNASMFYALDDYTWLDPDPTLSQMPEDSEMMQAVPVSSSTSVSGSGSGSGSTPQQCPDAVAALKYNLLLEDVQPETLSHIMDVVLKSQRQVKMKLSSAESLGGYA